MATTLAQREARAAAQTAAGAETENALVAPRLRIFAPRRNDPVSLSVSVVTDSDGATNPSSLSLTTALLTTSPPISPSEIYESAPTPGGALTPGGADVDMIMYDHESEFYGSMQMDDGMTDVLDAWNVRTPGFWTPEPATPTTASAPATATADTVSETVPQTEEL